MTETDDVSHETPPSDAQNVPDGALTPPEITPADGTAGNPARDSANLATGQEPPKPPRRARSRAAQGRADNVDARRRLVAQMHFAGYSVREIAANIGALRSGTRGEGPPIYEGANRSTIGRDLIALKAEWSAGAIQDVGAAKERQLVELNHDLEYWRRATLQAEATERVRIYQHIVIPLLRERAKLLGLNAPTKVDVSRVVEQWAKEEGYDAGRLLEIVTDIAAAAGMAEL